MVLINKKNHKVIIKDVWRAGSFSARHLGLIGKRSFSEKALAIPKCSQVHTFFMRFPIDILFMDKQNIVVGKQVGLKPWRLSARVKGAAYVIEAEAGSFGDDIVINGDQVVILIPDDQKQTKEGSA
ncbi:hypothetical protein CR205_14120 [Alteribacter lacisalsi]|uniref:DUF192 domain-containing protein n=2 Tax=Alteribacter lacisalsi TaxID=2045244 RepID=A0A2W0HIK2_9BACI|nr:hypothetical protein CR205_14120 [Alteribacter lacisalsi]